MNELFEKELQNISINDKSLSDYVTENYVPMSVIKPKFEDIYELIKTQKKIIQVQDTMLENKDEIITNLNAIIANDEKIIEGLKNIITALELKVKTAEKK